VMSSLLLWSSRRGWRRGSNSSIGCSSLEVTKVVEPWNELVWEEAAKTKRKSFAFAQKDCDQGFFSHLPTTVHNSSSHHPTSLGILVCLVAFCFREQFISTSSSYL
jgi:hypothetical protein